MDRIAFRRGLVNVIVLDLPTYRQNPNQMNVKDKLCDYIIGSCEIRTRCYDLNLKMNNIFECLNNTPNDCFWLNTQNDYIWFDLFRFSPLIIIAHNGGYHNTKALSDTLVSVLEIKTLVSGSDRLLNTFMFGIRRFGNERIYRSVEETFQNIVQMHEQTPHHDVPRVYVHDFTLSKHVDHVLNVYEWITNVQGELAREDLIDEACICLKRYARINGVNNGNFRQVILTCIYLVLCYRESEVNMDPDLFCFKTYVAIAGFTNRSKFENYVFNDVFKSLNYYINSDNSLV